MLLDLIFGVFIVLAIWKGWRNGLIVGLFSFVAILVGLAAAVKLSAVVANEAGKRLHVSERWLPLLAFVAVFLAALVLVRLGARAIEKLTQSLMLGFVNRIGGVLLYALIYLMVLSIMLFYGEQLGLIGPSLRERSVTYELVRPWGPRALDWIGSAIPFFRDMFAELQEFFGRLAQKSSTG
ncbi:MAG TPA: CvpA family protein [Chitinophagaceae bacterium]|nr:CvpA family protein [Chitinophagaceae bacterium]